MKTIKKDMIVVSLTIEMALNQVGWKKQIYIIDPKLWNISCAIAEIRYRSTMLISVLLIFYR